jgi:hypothetical protein
VERIKMLKERYGIDGFVDCGTMKTLRDGEMIRHLIVHNGRKVSQEYLNQTHGTDAKLGEVIPITGAYIEKLGLKSRIFIRNFFISVSMKFFKKNKEELAEILPFTSGLRTSQPTEC